MYCLDLLENTTWISRLSAAAQTKGFGRLAEWVAGSGQPSRLRRNEKHEDALSNMMLNGRADTVSGSEKPIRKRGLCKTLSHDISSRASFFDHTGWRLTIIASTGVASAGKSTSSRLPGRSKVGSVWPLANMEANSATVQHANRMRKLY